MCAILLPPVLLALAAAPAREPVRWAVIVGIDDYVELGDEPGGDLLGAENDARAIRDVLMGRYGFAENNITLLLSRAATRAAIRDALTQWLPSRVRAGDLVVFYFAGHGSMLMDDGADEEDGIDETICPTDVLRGSGANDIRDDELGAWLRALPTRQVIVILDSCHSGTATRQLAGSRPRALERELAPAPAMHGDAWQTVQSQSATDLSDIIEIAAASPAQAAMDATFTLSDGGVYHGGAFTTHLVRRLWQAPPNASYRDLFLNTFTSVKGDRFSQDPQLSGPADLPVLMAPLAGVSAGDGMVVQSAVSQGRRDRVTEVTVQDVRADAIILNGGTDRGLAPGALLELERGGLVRVTHVSERTAAGVLSRGSARQQEKAWLTEIALPVPRLMVGVAELDDNTRARMSALLSAEPDIQLTSDGLSDLHVVLDSAGAGLVLLARDGGARGLAGVGRTDVHGIAELLLHELGILRLMNLDNPAADFLVDIDVADGRRSFRVGDDIAFNVTTTRSGYLTLIDLSSDGTLSVLYPNSYMTDAPLVAGRTLTVPGTGLYTFTVEEPTGPGVVRAIVTDEPLPLRSTAGDDAGAGHSAAFAALIRRQLAGSDTAAVMKTPATTWSSAVALYYVVN